MKVTEKKILVSQIQTNPAFPIDPLPNHKIKISDIPVLVHKKNIKKGKLPFTVYEIISGHTRLEAADKEGLKEISCLVLDEEPELIEKLQRLDWAHNFGEHEILKHHDAYAHYKKLKAQYLQRKLSPELETQEAWESHIYATMQNSVRYILTNIIDESHHGFIDALANKINSNDRFIEKIKIICHRIADENFKLGAIETQAPLLVEIISEELNQLAKEATDWAKLAPLNLSLPNEPIEFNQGEIHELLPQILDQDKVYKHHAQAALDFNRTGLITGSSYFYKSIAISKELNNDKNHTFNKEFLIHLMKGIKLQKGQEVSTLFDTEEYNIACSKDFTLRLNKALKVLYTKIKRDADKISITQDYIEKCFDEKNIISSIFPPSNLELNNIKQASDILKNVFVKQIKLSISNKNKIKQTLLRGADDLLNDVYTSSLSIEFLQAQLEKINRESVAEYTYAESRSLHAENTAQILGFLLFMLRSYKHFVKNKFVEQEGFFKKKLPFSIIKNFLANNKKHDVVETEDAITIFPFMLELGNLGAVTTQLKISTHGTCDYHVDSLGSYRTKVDNIEVSDLHHTARSIILKHDNTLKNKNAVIDQTISKWMGSVLKLEKPDIDHLPQNTQKNLIRLLIHHVFTLFYIEGLRNPAAFVIHPMLLNELMAKPLEALNKYIVDGNFIMTPVGSKNEGEGLHAFFQPSLTTPVAFYKSIKTFTCADDNMAERSVAALKNLDGPKLLTQFNLRTKKV